MSETVGGLPYEPIEFTKEGAIHDLSQLGKVVGMCREKGLTDLVVISHGWKNNIEEAENLYTTLFGNVRTLLDDGVAPAVPRDTLGAVGIFWPSKKYTPEELQPGGGASVGGEQELDALLKGELDELAAISVQPNAVDLADQAKNLLASLGQPAEADRFVKAVLDLLAEPGGRLTEDLPSEVTELPGRELLERLAEVDLEDDEQPFEGGGAGLLGSLKQGTKRFLNLLTYFKMKKRAGIVGERGVASMLQAIKRDAPSVRLHLVGHSFGGRLVAAASSCLGFGGIRIVETVCFLQAAFSHNGFARDYRGSRDGYFRPAVTHGGVRKRISVTHTHNDKANLMAYPLASRIHREHGSALGDEDDRFGAIGANGALVKYTPEAAVVTMPPARSTYQPPNGKLIANFLADSYIADHNDVKNINVANLVLLTIEEGIA